MMLRDTTHLHAEHTFLVIHDINHHDDMVYCDFSAAPVIARLSAVFAAAAALAAWRDSIAVSDCDGSARHATNLLVSSSRSKLRPMKMIRFILGSFSFHGRPTPSSELENPMSMCTAWNTNLASEPAMLRTPFERNMSTPFSWRSRVKKALSLSRSSSPSNWHPTLLTDKSCMCSPSVSKKSSSTASTRSRSKALIPTTRLMSTSA
mmetsp:Transcript_16677/g.22401  ORF Transcript_16677/g.22401 Transcript_16677/m.22401 type:complete len:206 (-) Transcript_16677:621-1238(-)